MRYLKLFENHQTEAEVAEICQRYGIKEWTLIQPATVILKSSTVKPKQSSQTSTVNPSKLSIVEPKQPSQTPSKQYKSRRTKKAK